MSDIKNLYNDLTNFYNVNDENFKEFMAKIYDEMLANHRDVKYVKEHLYEEIVKILDEYLVDGKIKVNIRQVVDEFLNNSDVIKDINTDINDMNTSINNSIIDINTDIEDLNSQLDTKAKQSDLEVERARIDNFTRLSEGSTTGDAELIDARIGTDGVVYSNVGNSIRTQINRIDSNIESYIGQSLKYKYEWLNGGYIDNTNGNLVNHDNWKYTDFIKIADGIKSLGAFTTLEGSYSYNAFYDINKTFISNFSVNSSVVNVPTNAAYFRISSTKNSNTIITNIVESLSEKCNENQVRELSKGITNDLKENLINDYIGIKTEYEYEWINGGYIDNTNGNIVNYDNWQYTDYIELDEVNQLEVSTTLTGSYSYNAFYDVNKIFIKSIRVSDNIIDKPSNAKYMRLSVNKGSTTIVKNKIDKLIEKCTIEEVKELIGGSGATDIITLNKDVEPFVIQASEGLGQMFTDKTKPLVFTHFSDIHTKQELWNRIVEYNNHYKDYLKFSIHTGDYCGGNRLAYIDLYANGTSCNIPLLNCVGNHDTFLSDNSKGDKKTTHDLLFNHTNNWDVHFMDIENSMTYHKDFDKEKIRLIVLDYYYDIDAQCTWLLERLNGAKALGYHVVTCMHEMTNTIINKLDTTFNTIDNFDLIGGNKNSKSKFDKVIGDWIKTGGVHVANFAGHEHSDYIGFTENNVLNVCVQAATDDTIWTDGKRVKGTKTWDCFNVVSVETSTGTLKLIRVGNNSDHYLREKKILSYDYINRRIIHS